MVGQVVIHCQPLRLCKAKAGGWVAKRPLTGAGLQSAQDSKRAVSEQRNCILRSATTLSSEVSLCGAITTVNSFVQDLPLMVQCNLSILHRDQSTAVWVLNFPTSSRFVNLIGIRSDGWTRSIQFRFHRVLSGMQLHTTLYIYPVFLHHPHSSTTYGPTQKAHPSPDPSPSTSPS